MQGLAAASPGHPQPYPPFPLGPRERLWGGGRHGRPRTHPLCRAQPGSVPAVTLRPTLFRSCDVFAPREKPSCTFLLVLPRRGGVCACACVRMCVCVRVGPCFLCSIWGSYAPRAPGLNTANGWHVSGPLPPAPAAAGVPRPVPRGACPPNAGPYCVEPSAPVCLVGVRVRVPGRLHGAHCQPTMHRARAGGAPGCRGQQWLLTTCFVRP